MKIMWLVNVKIPLIYRILGESNKTNVGGWLDQVSERIKEEKEHSLSIVYPTNKKEGEEGEYENISYRGVYFEPRAMNAGKLAAEKYIEEFKEMLRVEKPDIIHIHGTEFQHAYFMTEAAKEIGISDCVVISIQGMVGYYAKHYEFGLPWYVKYGRTVKEIILNRCLHTGMKEYLRRGVYEKKAILNVKHIIGRTNWDEGCVKLINPNITYHFCNETLRKAFYGKRWEYEICEPYTIFVSQASYPIKGFHILLRALKLVKQVYPQLKVRVAGPDITQGNIVNGFSYSLYIKSLINKYELRDSIVFVGPQNEIQMRENMLKANVFVSPSTIENSPNSLGEAMIMGVPCITSDVGGVANLLIHNKEGYIYPLDEYYMLAFYIIKIFSESSIAKSLGARAAIHANETHNPDMNYAEMFQIYRRICNER